MDSTPTVEGDQRKLAVEAFCDECVWARSMRTHFAALFESGERRRELLFEAAGIFFHDLNAILIDYVLLLLCRLTDPASSAKDQTNLTTNYVLSLNWSEETKLVLSAKNDELESFRSKVVGARNKLIAHLDLRVRMQPYSMGEFSEADEAGFWRALQDFVNAAHEEAVGGPFEIDAAMSGGDAESLVHCLSDGIDYGDLMDANPSLLLQRAAMRRFDAV